MDGFQRSRFFRQIKNSMGFAFQKKQSIDEVQNKIDRLHRPKGFSCRPVLIHVNGVNESVVEQDYFSHIIDFTNFILNYINILHADICK